MGLERDVTGLLKTIEKLHGIQDLHLLLERSLHEARTFLNADAGTIYLKERGKLYFRFIENDTLFKNGAEDNKHLYYSSSIEISMDSVAGFVAKKGEPLMIDDVYDLPVDVSYHFNPEFDKKSKYRTKSLLVVPIKSSSGQIHGVIQLINAKDDSGEIQPFSGMDRIYLSYFAQSAAQAIERAYLSRDMVLRMVEMVALRDPFETINHATRVGEFALELYDRYADARDVSSTERYVKKDIFRTAAMLHDVGKFGVEDQLMNREGPLSDEEKSKVYLHTIYGARLFQNNQSLYDRVAHEVALNHHERWDGRGYPGKYRESNTGEIHFGTGKKGEEIPLSSRIVSICDVFDTLIMRRAYKDPWDVDSALHYIRSKAGKQFDPELVDLFVNMKEIILAIIANHPVLE
jgi:HD-GYP domain-containing protein (c-di-GMP phosphodiesterase class II)